ncbi:hypothetical protein GCM10025876_34030 [Demequina litorisediminis]|uniref:Uncharacterized protein n=1 Tax=Demequina litorisediminis TaxID=1849022 RepID=A0ABQ6IKK7_9MICO|nr:hypothetical protein GCM10025876_34030 [Demequina litorisediminis]
MARVEVADGALDVAWGAGDVDDRVTPHASQRCEALRLVAVNAHEGRPVGYWRTPARRARDDVAARERAGGDRMSKECRAAQDEESHDSHHIATSRMDVGGFAVGAMCGAVATAFAAPAYLTPSTKG